MKEKVSSPFTRFYKIFPPVFAVIYGSGAVWAAKTLSWFFIPFAVVSLGFIAISLWFSPKVKFVLFGENGWYFDEHSKEVHVPWIEIEGMYYIPMRGPVYRVKFRNSDRFSRSIFFYLRRSRPEIAEKMQGLIRQAHKPLIKESSQPGEMPKKTKQRTKI